jgi:Flp pilus assembly protein TadG
MPGRTLFRSRLRQDRGSVSLWVVIFSFITMVLLTLVVDGGQVMIVKSRAADIAEQAARAAADDIVPAALRNDDQVVVAGGACGATGPAADLISTYAKGADVTASMQSCAIGTDTQGTPDVTVEVQVSMTPVIPAGAFSSIQVSASETAYLACGTADQQTAC